MKTIKDNIQYPTPQFKNEFERITGQCTVDHILNHLGVDSPQELISICSTCPDRSNCRTYDNLKDNLVASIEDPEYYTANEAAVLAETASQHHEESIEKYYHWGSEEIKGYLSESDYEIFIAYCETFQLEHTSYAEEQVRWLLTELIGYESAFRNRLIAVYDNVWFYNR